MERKLNNFWKKESAHVVFTTPVDLIQIQIAVNGEVSDWRQW